MKIFDVMVSRYIRDVVDSYYEDHGQPDDVSEYDSYIDDVRSRATRCGHFELLRLGLEYLLGHPEIDVRKWMGTHYGIDDGEYREGIEYMRKQLWPTARPVSKGGPPGVELVPCTWEVWNYKMPGTPD